MSLRFSSLCLSFLVLGLGANAQEVMLEEDFESGFPTEWWMSGTLPWYWHVAEDGECGAVTRMMAFNHGPASCTYTTYSFSVGGVIATPYVVFDRTYPLEVHFDYRLDIDVDDIVEVVIAPDAGASWTPYSIATSDDLWPDGNVHSVSVQVLGAHPQVGESFRVEWWISSDTMGNQGFGWMVDDVAITQHGMGEPYCFGDGSGLLCPCGNDGAPGEGCANSGGLGARLETHGSSSVSLDDLSFQASGLPPGQSALLFQGTVKVNGGLGILFGDGLRCAGGQVIRLGVETADPGGNATWGPGFAASGGWVAGEARYFQVWYRDPLGSPCANAFNLSHGSSVPFAP